MGETITSGNLEFFVENRAVGEDGGPSLQVLGPIDGQKVQLLRFDMFYKGPHYHYAPNGKNIRYDLDPLTVDDGIEWAMRFLRAKLPQMVALAGYPESTAAADTAGANRALDEVERRWRSQPPASE